MLIETLTVLGISVFSPSLQWSKIRDCDKERARGRIWLVPSFSADASLGII